MSLNGARGSASGLECNKYLLSKNSTRRQGTNRQLWIASGAGSMLEVTVYARANTAPGIP